MHHAYCWLCLQLLCADLSGAGTDDWCVGLLWSCLSARYCNVLLHSAAAVLCMQAQSHDIRTM